MTSDGGLPTRPAYGVVVGARVAGAATAMLLARDYGDGVEGAEPRMAPRQEQVDALLAQEALRREQRQHPVAKQSVRRRRVHEGDGYPAAVPIPTTAGS